MDVRLVGRASSRTEATRLARVKGYRVTRKRGFIAKKPLWDNGGYWPVSAESRD